MIKASEILNGDLLQALDSAIKNGELPPTQVSDAAIERPQNTHHGDFASSLPLKLAREMKMSPMTIGKILSNHIPEQGIIGESQIAPPGFVNLKLDSQWLLSQIHQIRDLKNSFGNLDVEEKKKISLQPP